MLHPTPDTNPPYQIMEIGWVIGRNSDSSVLYLTSKAMSSEKGVCAYPGGIHEISVPNIVSYLILRRDLLRALK